MSYSDEFNARARQTHLQLSAAGLAEEAGLQSLNNVREDDTPKHRRQKKQEQRYYDFLQLLTETQIKLQDFIDEIDRDLLQARHDLEQHKDMLAERIALEHCIDILEHDGLLERNADGSLKDKNLERAVTRYLEDNNMEVDLSDDARIYAVSKNLIITYPSRDQLNDVIDLDEQIVGTFEYGKEQALDLQDRLDNSDLSGQELMRISNGADALFSNTYSAIGSLTDKRDKLLNVSNVTNAAKQDFFEIPFSNNASSNTPIKPQELPTTTLKF